MDFEAGQAEVTDQLVTAAEPERGRELIVRGRLSG